MSEFTMPSLGADMDAGTVTEWLVKVGDEVHRGDVVAVVETSKSTIDVEIFETGRIEEIVVPEGVTVPVGAVLARVAPLVEKERAGEKVPVLVPQRPSPTRAAGHPSSAPAPSSERPSAPASAPLPPGREPAGALLSPVVRHLAEHLGVETSGLVGTGLGGRITRADVELAAARGRRRVSPFARRVASELGIDLGVIGPGSGPEGVVVEADVRQAAAGAATPTAPAARPAPAVGAPKRATTHVDSAQKGAKQAAMRQAIGALMARSKREIPHYYLSTTVDMRRAVAWLEQTNLGRPIAERLAMPVLLLKATALAVASVPEMNGFMKEGAFEPSSSVHVGVAVSLRGGGVIAPAIHDVPELSLDALMAALHDLVDRARHGSLRSSEMSDPTITVTNLGDLGVESVFGVIYPPQVALVGFGRTQERPWAHDGMVGVRPTVIVTLSADHRVSDGHRGGVFLSTIDKQLQAPEAL